VAVEGRPRVCNSPAYAAPLQTWRHFFEKAQPDIDLRLSSLGIRARMDDVSEDLAIEVPAEDLTLVERAPVAGNGTYKRRPR
jgi:hypothetical protein